MVRFFLVSLLSSASAIAGAVLFGMFMCAVCTSSFSAFFATSTVALRLTRVIVLAVYACLGSIPCRFWFHIFFSS